MAKIRQGKPAPTHGPTSPCHRNALSMAELRLLCDIAQEAHERRLTQEALPPIELRGLRFVRPKARKGPEAIIMAMKAKGILFVPKSKPKE
jgi:hypothetical protein